MEATEGCGLRAGFLSLLSYAIKDHLPSGGTTRSGLWAFSHQALVKKCPMGLPKSQSDGGIFSNRGSLFPDYPR